MSTYTLSGSIGRDHYQTSLSTAAHRWHGDEPAEHGGTDTAPSPSELVLSGLAACKLITLRGYIDRKEWNVARIELDLTMTVDPSVRPVKTEIRTDFRFEGELDEAQRQRLLEIAGKCPIHRMLTGEITIF
jgi:putative redox protein